MADTLDSYDCGVLILPMKNLAKRIAKTQNYEKAIEEIQLGKPFLNLPILVIGVGIDENNPSCIIDIDSMIDWETIKTKNLLIDFAKKNNTLLQD